MGKMGKRLKFFGLLFALFILTGCPFDDKTYTTAEEQYAIGWILHNVDETTDTNLDYSEKDFAVYNYSYNFPATQPQYFVNVLFWIPPIHENSGGIFGASDIRLGVPLNRVYYVKGENPAKEDYESEWSFSNFIYLNYIRSEEGYAQFALDSSQTEYYSSTNNFHALTPVPGDRRQIYFGKAPFTPASFIIKDDVIQLNGHLMRGYNNNSYLLRSEEASTQDLFTGEISMVKIPMPNYKVYLNGELKEERNLTDFDFTRAYYSISGDGNYVANLSIPINYPVWNNTIITAAFTAPSEELQPPEFQHIEANPYFTAGEDYKIAVDLYDESGIEKVEIYAQENNEGEKWVLLDAKEADAEKNIYDASYVPKEGADKINLKISAVDNIGNSVNYTILPVALPGQSITFNFEPQNNASKGDLVKINGRCKIGSKEFCNGFLLKHYLNNELLENDKTSDEGKFILKWEVPFEYGHGDANLTVKYSGTGIYLPHEETVTIPIESFDIDVSISKLKISEANLGEPVTVSAIARNFGSENAANILIEFRIEDSLLGKTLIPELKPGEEKIVSFEWAPEHEGYYNIKLLAIAESDKKQGNNILEEGIEISYIAPNVAVWLNQIDTALLEAETSVEFELSNWGEEKSDDIKASLYDFYKPGWVYLNFAEQEAEPSNVGKSDSGGGGSSPAKPAEPEPGKKISDIYTLVYNGTEYNISASYNGSVSANISTETFKDILYFTYDERVKKLQNDIFVHMPYFSSFSAEFVIGNATPIEKNLDGLDVYEQKTDYIKWVPKNKGEYLLLLFANTSKDSNLESNYYSNYIKVLGEGINIKARILLDYSKDFIEGVVSNISANITNMGTEDAKNIRVTLFEQKEESKGSEELMPEVKKKQIGTAKIGNLAEKESKEVKFEWTPSKAGGNYILLVAEAKKDIYPDDNDEIAYVNVISRQADVNAVLFYPDGDIFAGDKITIAGRVFNAGKADATSVSASLYEVKDKAKKLVGKKDIGLLGPDSSSEVSFDWVPDSSGGVYLELEAEAANDGNKDNNMESMHIAVLSKEYDVKPEILYYPKFIVVGDNANIGVILNNFGSKAAPEFNLILKANGVEADSTIVERLEAKTDEFVGLNWQPSAEGTYEIEVAIDLNDSNNGNNIAKDTIKVFKTKEVSISFVDKDGNSVERQIELGNVGTSVNGIASLRIPDIPLDLWIEKQDPDGIAASLYSNSSINGKLTIASSYTNKPIMQDGLLLYNVFANNDSWNYKSFSSLIQKSFETLDIRYTELKAFMCNNYNFSSDKCSKWEETSSNVLFSSGNLILTAKASKSQAFAIGDADYDDDNAPDWDDSDNDNDGIDDSDDSFTCNGKFKSRNKLNVMVNNSKDIRKKFKDVNKVNISDKNKPLVEFDINLSKDSMDCREVIVEKQPEVTTRGYTLISGVKLTSGTKTAFVDKISRFNRVCIKDEEVSSINEVTQNCDGSNEFLVMCDGIKHGAYTCTNLSSQYKVEGLVHSAVAEPTTCQESWDCGDWSACTSKRRTRVCTETNGCGTAFNKPALEESCSAHDDDDENDGGGITSGTSSRGSVYGLGEIKNWADGKSQILKLEKNDLVTLDFNRQLNRIVLASIEGTSIKLSMSFKSALISLVVGETKNFDLDRDGKEDMSITFKEISLNKATLIFTRINPAAAPTKKESEKKSDVPKLSKPPVSGDEPKKEADKAKDTGTIKAKKSSWLSIAMASFGVALVIVVAAFGLVYLKRYNEEKEEDNFGMGKKSAPQKSEFQEVESYILKELNRGIPIDQIKDVLVKAGWKEELVELVVRDVNDKNRRRN